MKREVKFPYHIVLPVLLGWLAIAFPRMLISPLLPTIESEFHVSHARAALLMSSYLLPYAIMQIPAGSISDRFGNKPFMILALLGSSIGSFLISFTSNFNQALVVRFFSGMLSGLWFTSSSNIIIQNTNSSMHGRALGLVYSGASIANALIFVTVGATSKGIAGWRYFFVISSIPGFFCLALIYLFTKDLKEKSRNNDDRVKNINLAVFMKHLKSRTLVIALTFNFLTSLAGWSLSAFVPTYLVLERGLLVAEASTVMIVLAASSIFHSSIGGYVADRFGIKLPVLVSGTAMCLVSSLFPILPLGLPIMILLLIWGLIGGWSFTAFNLVILRSFPKTLRGTFLGIYNQVGFISATLGPPLFGLIIDIAGFKSFFTLSLVLYIISLPIVLLIRDGQIENNI